MSSRIHQLFGDDLAGRIFVAAAEAGESEQAFVRRLVGEALAPDSSAVEAEPGLRDALTRFVLSLFVALIDLYLLFAPVRPA